MIQLLQSNTSPPALDIAKATSQISLTRQILQHPLLVHINNDSGTTFITKVAELEKLDHGWRPRRKKPKPLVNFLPPLNFGGCLFIQIVVQSKCKWRWRVLKPGCTMHVLQDHSCSTAVGKVHICRITRFKSLNDSTKFTKFFSRLVLLLSKLVTNGGRQVHYLCLH